MPSSSRHLGAGRAVAGVRRSAAARPASPAGTWVLFVCVYIHTRLLRWTDPDIDFHAFPIMSLGLNTRVFMPRDVTNPFRPGPLHCSPLWKIFSIRYRLPHRGRRIKKRSSAIIFLGRSVNRLNGRICGEATVLRRYILLRGLLASHWFTSGWLRPAGI